MKMTDAPENFRFDLERIIDDFIFMCFFAGNDFLPRMPTLDIHEVHTFSFSILKYMNIVQDEVSCDSVFMLYVQGAIDLLMTVYKEQFKNIGGYLVDMQRVITPEFDYFIFYLVFYYTSHLLPGWHVP